MQTLGWTSATTQWARPRPRGRQCCRHCLFGTLAKPAMTGAPVSNARLRLLRSDGLDQSIIMPPVMHTLIILIPIIIIHIAPVQSSYPSLSPYHIQSRMLRCYSFFKIIFLVVRFFFSLSFPMSVSFESLRSKSFAFSRFFGQISFFLCPCCCAAPSCPMLSFYFRSSVQCSND